MGGVIRGLLKIGRKRKRVLAAGGSLAISVTLYFWPPAQQHTEGASSPAISGNNNVVTSGWCNLAITGSGNRVECGDPQMPALLEEVRDALKKSNSTGTPASTTATTKDLTGLPILSLSTLLTTPPLISAPSSAQLDDGGPTKVLTALPVLPLATTPPLISASSSAQLDDGAPTKVLTALPVLPLTTTPSLINASSTTQLDDAAPTKAIRALPALVPAGADAR